MIRWILFLLFLIFLAWMYRVGRLQAFWQAVAGKLSINLGG